MNEDYEIKLFHKLDGLRKRHQTLEDNLSTTRFDEFSAQRMKKEKLALRDQIHSLEHQLYPNIIA
jgi:hypothetical protein